MEKELLPHNKRNCYLPYPDQYLKVFHWRQNCFEILQHIKNSGGGGIHHPPSPLYHGGGMYLRVRPRVNAAWKLNSWVKSTSIYSWMINIDIDDKSLLLLICFTNTSSLLRLYVDLTSTLHRRYIDPISTSLLLNFITLSSSSSTILLFFKKAKGRSKGQNQT